MQAHVNRPSIVEFADHDGDLIAKALAAAKHDEFRSWRALERDGSPAHDVKRADLRLAVAVDRRRLDADQRLVRDLIQRHRCDHQGGNDEGKGGELDRAVIERGGLGDRRVQLSVDLEDELFDAVDVDFRQSDGAGHLAVGRAETAQARGGQGQTRLAAGQVGHRLDQSGVDQLGAGDDGRALAASQHHRTPAAQFRDRPVDAQQILIGAVTEKPTLTHAHDGTTLGSRIWLQEER